MNGSMIILGSTGSVGTQAADVARANNIKVDAITAGRNVKIAEEQIREFKPRLCAMADNAAARDLAARVADTGTKVLSGTDGIIEAINETEAKVAVNSILGLAGLAPTIAAAKCGMRIAIANKESLVAAGDIVKAEVRANGAELIPVDSEHSAIFQCLHAGKSSEVKRLLLTASGGPFYGYSAEQLRAVTRADALKHPTWSMGAKITIDSATLMNKGLEVIEAVRLFDVAPSQVQVVVHRESIIHSAVEYIDNAVIAELSHPDMRECVQFAITYPDRCEAVIEPLDLFKVGTLTFKEPDRKTFRLLDLAYKAIETGGLLPAVLSSANEAAVALFLADKIKFYQIAEVVEDAMNAFTNKQEFTIEDVFAADREVRDRIASKF